MDCSWLYITAWIFCCQVFLGEREKRERSIRDKNEQWKGQEKIGIQMFHWISNILYLQTILMN